MTTVPKDDAWIQFLTATPEQLPAMPAFQLLPPFLAYSSLPPPPTLDATMAATAHWTQEDWQHSKERVAALKEKMRLNEIEFEKWRVEHKAATDELDRKWQESMASRFPVKLNKK